MPLTQGQTIRNRYRVARLLEQGGMGAVYRAWDLTLNIPVALKEMLPDPQLSQGQLAELREQFQREAQVLAGLSHPSLPRVTDYFNWNGNNYLVMDFVEGQSLASIIEARGALPEEHVLLWAEQLLSALEACHARSIVHRDIKPQNIIIRQDGRAVLVDFGLVKLWDPKNPQTRRIIQQMGTREYAPPEQFKLRDDDHTEPHSDVYSLSATLYHALTGKEPPCALNRISQPLNQISLQQSGVRISPDVERVLNQGLALDPRQRFANASDMYGELSRATGHMHISPTPPPPRDLDPPSNSFGWSQPVRDSVAPPQDRQTRPRSALWYLELLTALGIAVVSAVALQFFVVGDVPVDYFFRLGLGSLVGGSIGWFIGDVIFQAMTGAEVHASGGVGTVRRPTQKLVMSTRHFMKRLTSAQQVGLIATVLILAVLAAWLLGPVVYEINWLWVYFPSYTIVGPLVYAATGHRMGLTALANALVILIGGPVLTGSIGLASRLDRYLPGVIVGGLLIEALVFISERTLLKRRWS